jgi:hypothetical protein
VSGTERVTAIAQKVRVKRAERRPAREALLRRMMYFALPKKRELQLSILGGAADFEGKRQKGSD